MTGCLTQEDPIGYAGGSNLYGYVGNNPVSFADPFGLCPEDAGGDGETEGFDDCPEGSSGWYANRLATGEGNALLNQVGGALASCGESLLCQGVLALASLGSSVAASAGGQGAAVAAESGAGRVVIGETMDRVRTAAGRLGGEVFETTASTARQMWKENSSWLRGAMRAGKEIVDIGLDAGRAVRSVFYQAERALIESRGYPTTVIR